MEAPAPLTDLGRMLVTGAETDGAVRASIDLPRVPLRGRYSLDLRLIYSSDVGSGTAGVGWSLAEDYIEEAQGALTWRSGEALLELRPASQPARFLPKDAEHRRTFDRLSQPGGDHFEAFDEIGNRWIYDKLVILGDGAKRWHLGRVGDGSGNYARYRYLDEAPLPESVEYNHYLKGAAYVPHSRVRFGWAERSDTYCVHVGRAALLCDRLLTGVFAESYVANVWRTARSLQLVQQLSDETGRNLLVELTQRGADGQALPPVKFGYGTPSVGAFAAPSFTYEGPLSIQDHYRAPSSGYGQPALSDIKRAANSAYLDADVLDLNRDGVPEVVTTHHLDFSAYAKWGIRPALPAGHPLLAGFDAGAAERPLWDRDLWAGTQYHGGYPDPSPGYESNNWQLFSLVRQELPPAAGQRTMIAAMVSLWRGAPLALVMPYLFFRRYQVAGETRLREMKIEHAGEWLCLSNQGSKTAMFDVRGFIDVRALLPYAGASGRVPLQEIHELESFGSHAGETHYKDHERTCTMRFLIDLDGDGIVEYVIVLDGGRRWLVSKLAPPDQALGAADLGKGMRFGAPQVWNVPAALLPYEELTEATFNDPEYQATVTLRSSLLDVTRSGRPDFVRYEEATGNLAVFRNTGDGFVFWRTITSPLGGPLAISKSRYRQNLKGGAGETTVDSELFSLDASGALQHARFDTRPDGARVLHLRPLHADRWAAATHDVAVHSGLSWTSNLALANGAALERLRWTDFWSDGRIAMVSYDGTKGSTVFPGLDQRPDLLCSVDNGLGHEVTLEYAYAGDFLRDRFRAPHPARRYNARPVCIRLRECDRHAHADWQLAFWYSQPEWHADQPGQEDPVEARAFQLIERFDSRGTVIRTYKSGGLPTATRVLFDPVIAGRFGASANDPHLFHDVVRPYHEQAPTWTGGALYARALPTLSIDSRYASISRPVWLKETVHDLEHNEAVSTHVSAQYNAGGSVTRHQTDLRVREIDYVTTPGFTGLVAEERIRTPGGGLVQRSRNFYDFKPQGQAGTGGNLTRLEVEIYRVDGNGGSPLRTMVTTFGYTGHGLVTEEFELDGASHHTRTVREYDPYFLFPVAESVMPGSGGGVTLTKRFGYDEVSHKCTWIQSPSGAVAYTDYDLLDRVTRASVSASPNGPRFTIKTLAYVVERGQLVVEERTFDRDTTVGGTPRTTPVALRRTFLSGVQERVLQVKEQDLATGRIVALDTVAFDRLAQERRRVVRVDCFSMSYEPIGTGALDDSHATVLLREYGAAGNLTAEVLAHGSAGAPTDKLSVVRRSEYRREVHGYGQRILTRRSSDLTAGTSITEEVRLDPWGRRVLSVDGAGQSVAVDYDLNDQIGSLRRGGTQIFLWRDSTGRLLDVSDPETAGSSHVHDSFGNTLLIKSRNFLPDVLPPLAPPAELMQEMSDAHWLQLALVITNLDVSDAQQFRRLTTAALMEFSVGWGDWVDQAIAFLWAQRPALLPLVGAKLDATVAPRLLAILGQDAAAQAAFAGLWYATRPGTQLAREFDHLNRMRSESVLMPRATWTPKLALEWIPDDAQRRTFRYDDYSDPTAVAAAIRPYALGLLTEIQTALETIELSYDFVGHVARKRYLRSGRPVGLTFSHDFSGKVHDLRATGERSHRPLDEHVHYQYDPSGRLERLDLTGAGPAHSLSVIRDPQGRVTNLPGETIGYDPALDVPRSVDTLLASFRREQLTLDPIGRVGTRIRTDANGAGTRRTYAYDAVHRLASWTDVSLDASGKETGDAVITTRRYDGVNNLLDVSRVQAGETTWLKRFDYAPSFNRPHLLTHATLGAETVALDYLPDGTVRGCGKWRFTHDARGRIRQVSAANRVVDFAFDGEGRLATLGGSTDVEYFGPHLLFDSAQHTWALHAGAGELTLATKIVAGRGTRLLSHVHDTRGDLLAVIEQTASGTQAMSFDVDEDLRAVVSGALVPLAWLPAAVRGGTLVDAGGGELLLRCGPRLYVPSLEIFTAPDPLLAAPLFHGAYNRYRFGYNSTPNASDPSGFDVVGLIVAAIAGAIIGAIIGLEAAGGEWWGALLGGAIGAVVGGLSYAAGVGAAYVLGGGTIMQYSVEWAVFNAIRGATLAAIRNRNVVVAALTGAAIGLVSGAIVGAGMGADPLTLDALLLVAAGSAMGSGLQEVIDHGAFEKGFVIGLIKGLVSWAFAAISTFLDEYKGLIIVGLKAGKYSNAAVSTAGGLGRFLLRGILVNVATRSVVAGAAVAIPVYLLTENWSATLAAFLGTATAVAIATALYEIHVVDNVLARGFDDELISGNDVMLRDHSLTVQFGNLYGLSVMYFRVEYTF